MHGAAGKEHTNAPHGSSDHGSAQAHYMKMAKLYPEKAAYYHGLAGAHARGTKK